MENNKNESKKLVETPSTAPATTPATTIKNEPALKKFTEGSTVGHDSNILAPAPAQKQATHVDTSVSNSERWYQMPSADASTV